MTNEQQIRALIEAWAIAAHDGDLDTVLADHAPDIVMFDVPPPNQGVHGIQAYRDTWPPFFAWQASGALFDIESLDVVVGADVAFAYGLLRCGTPADLARDPEQRLRLTIGLRKIGGRWIVVHEHHSFPDTTPAPDALEP
jgi:ketosteroid isomerase-like protein